MPLYDYDCAACGTRFEVVHGVHADPPSACPVCGKGPVKKAFTPPTIHFKGSGWAKKERRATSAPSGSRSRGEGSSSGDAGPGGDAGNGSGGGDAGSGSGSGSGTSDAASTAASTTTTASSGASTD